jgi:hypothetical protein
MKTFSKQASTRLFKKLSALRATLSNEEREVLDSIVVTDEVSAHRLYLTKTPVKTTAKTAAKTSEVSAHKLYLTKTPIKTTAKAAAKTSEVDAHKMTPIKTPVKTARQTFRISFDVNAEEYKIQE